MKNLAKKYLIAAGAIALSTAAAHAAPPPYTGNDLFEACDKAATLMLWRDHAPPVDSNMMMTMGFCLGQISAVLYWDAHERAPCMGPDTGTGMLLTVVVGYMVRNPQERDLPFMEIALKAAKQAWHCGEK